MNAPLQPPSDAFLSALNGVLFSLMQWDQLATFWQKVDLDAGWYLYALGEAVPHSKANAAHVKQFILDIDALLHKEHDEDYCGIVYADNLEQPTFIKIYDPNHLGSSCGSSCTTSKSAILPGWIMSQMPPTELTPSWIVPQSRKRWWEKLLSSLR